MRLVIWHWDRYPTAPGVYLGCFPALGHDLTWVVQVVGPRSEVVERAAGGARVFEVRRRRDSRLPRPLAMVVNRWHKLVSFALKARLMRRLAAERPDVLQVRELITEGMVAAALARVYGIRFAFQFDHPHPEGRLHELDCEGRRSLPDRLLQRVRIALRGAVLRRADLVFPISDALGERIRRRDHVDPRRLITFPVGVARSFLDPGGAGSPLARAATAPPAVCYLGNLSARRSPGLLFAVLEETARRAPECRFLIIGRPTADAERLMSRFTAPDRLEFTGFVPHERIPGLLRMARVGIYPIGLDDPYGINRTCSPLKVMEYMSAGLPVVASRVQDAEKVLRESGGGVCVDNDPVAFAEAIVGYLRDPERARRDGTRGREYIEGHRLFEVLAREVEGAYERLLATGFPASESTTARGAAACDRLHPGQARGRLLE